MSFRNEEILSWVMPGLYFLCAGLFLLGCQRWPELCCCCGNELTNIEKYAKIVADMTALIIFAVTLAAFVLGWILNALGGWLFRCPYISLAVRTAYREIDPGISAKAAMKKYRADRRKIDLEKVDRFYYRYVFSRNMFTAQLILCIFSLFYGYFLIALAILVGFWRIILYRDLKTHASAVRIHANKSQR